MWDGTFQSSVNEVVLSNGNRHKTHTHTIHNYYNRLPTFRLVQNFDKEMCHKWVSNAPVCHLQGDGSSDLMVSCWVIRLIYRTSYGRMLVSHSCIEIINTLHNYTQLIILSSQRVSDLIPKQHRYTYSRHHNSHKVLIRLYLFFFTFVYCYHCYTCNMLEEQIRIMSLL